MKRTVKIVIEKFDVDEFIDWVKRTRRKIARDVYKFSLEDESMKVFLDANYTIM